MKKRCLLPERRPEAGGMPPPASFLRGSRSRPTAASIFRGGWLLGGRLSVSALPRSGSPRSGILRRPCAFCHITAKKPGFCRAFSNGANALPIRGGGGAFSRIVLRDRLPQDEPAHGLAVEGDQGVEVTPPGDGLAGGEQNHDAEEPQPKAPEVEGRREQQQ